MAFKQRRVYIIDHNLTPTGYTVKIILLLILVYITIRNIISSYELRALREAIN